MELSLHGFFNLIKSFNMEYQTLILILIVTATCVYWIFFRPFEWKEVSFSLEKKSLYFFGVTEFNLKIVK